MPAGGGGVNHVTPHVPRARRSARRQAVLAFAYSAYLVAFAGAILAVASFVAPTGVAAVGAFAVAGAFAVVAGALLAIDTAGARRHPMAPVTPMPAAQLFARHGGQMRSAR